MKTQQWRRKVFSILLGGSLWQRYLAIYTFVALILGGWLFGPELLAWWFSRSWSLAWKLVTSIVLVTGFALWVAFFNLFWVNRVTQARAVTGALLAYLERRRQQTERPSNPEDGTE